MLFAKNIRYVAAPSTLSHDASHVSSSHEICNAAVLAMNARQHNPRMFILINVQLGGYPGMLLYSLAARTPNECCRY